VRAASRVGSASPAIICPRFIAEDHEHWLVHVAGCCGLSDLLPVKVPCDVVGFPIDRICVEPLRRIGDIDVTTVRLWTPDIIGKGRRCAAYNFCNVEFRIRAARVCGQHPDRTQISGIGRKLCSDFEVPISLRETATRIHLSADPRLAANQVGRDVVRTGVIR